MTPKDQEPKIETKNSQIKEEVKQVTTELVLKENKISTILITNRPYGLYGAFALGILGINTCVIQLHNLFTINHDIYKIWTSENIDAYLLCLKKLHMLIIDAVDVVYNFNENLINISIKDFLSKNPERQKK